MRSRIYSFALFFFVSFLHLPISLHAQDKNSFEKYWTAIDSLENIGLPKSAYEKTIIVLALAEKQNNKPEYIKSLIYKSKYLIQIEETKDDESFAREITRLEQEVNKVTQPAKSILQSMLGEMYFSYLQSNSWKFENRTNTKNFNNDDITTWTKKDYYEKAIYYYNISVQEEQPLLTPLSNYKNILTHFLDQKGKDDFMIYPTLFDFLLKRAILFYSNEQTFLTKPAYQFSVDDGSYFDAPELFIKKPLFSNDSFSTVLHVLKLYQKLLQFHLQDKDQTIFLVHDLARINFVYSKSIHPEKENLYIKSLEKIIEVFQNNPFSSDAYLQIAQWYHQNGNKYKPSTIGLNQWDLKTAISWCDKTIKRFPDARGSIEAAYLKASIEAPTMQIEGEKIYLPNTANLIKLSYKNIDTIYYRILELNNQNINNPYYDSEYEESQDVQKTINRFLKNKSLKSGEISIPNLGDYQLHHTELKIDALPIGRYVIILSRTKNFEQYSNLYSYHVFTNSHISYLAKSDTKSGCTSYYVLHRKTGQPLTNVKVEF